MNASSSTHDANRQRLAPMRASGYDFEPERHLATLNDVFANDAEVHLAFPFEDLDGAAALHETAFVPLHRAMPDLERRDFIVIAGDDPYGHDWVGCAGYYTGTFVADFLGISPSNQQASMRFHEFYRFVDGEVVEMQALWDIPELMMQSGVWPMAPSLGREWLVPGPATQDGLMSAPRDVERSASSTAHVVGMLVDMGKHPAEPVEAMRLERWWHSKFSWYGPAGIGTGRGIAGFRTRHQIPFLAALPDRRGGYKNDSHFFGDGPYVGVTAWPGMAATVTGDGWLGIAPAGQSITLRSLDFWRVEDGLIRENWVLVDLLSVYDQLGVDVFGRMAEVIAGRPGRLS